jgi:cell division protein FtsQ
MPKVVKPKKFPWRLVFTIAAWTTVAASAAVAAMEVKNFVMTDSHFALPNSGITFQGLRYASRSRVLQAFSSDFGRSAFHLPLAERRRRLLAVDWVEDASLTRVWPNRLIVRVQERKPMAFVNLSGGHYMLIDAGGVLLSPPPKTHFDFPVLSGVTEEQTERERSARVGAMAALLGELGPQAKLISEVNAASLNDLRVTLELEHRAIELWMGDHNFQSRFENFLSHYPEIRQSSEGVAVFDLRLDDRIITKQNL